MWPTEYLRNTGRTESQRMTTFRNDAGTLMPTVRPAPRSLRRFGTLDLGDAYALLRAVREQVRTGRYAPPVDDIAERIVAWLVPFADHLV
jgi:hypothetical protein